MVNVCGSSPRVRGTLIVHVVQVAGRRFIPAGAGNTSRAKTSCLCAAVHPRGCGEHRRALPVKCIFRGSSPRVRGTRHLPPQSVRACRFIPAGAGNTLDARQIGQVRPVHPRGCGEHRGESKSETSPHGSSPRVRGTRAGRKRPVYARRFIPAGAGNTGEHYP